MSNTCTAHSVILFDYVIAIMPGKKWLILDLG